MENCIFCKIAKGEIPAEKIYENDNFFSVPDIKPYVPGHSLIISKKHFETTLDLPSSLGQELLDCIKNTTIKIMDQEKADGFNLVNNNSESADQVVKHVHFHVLPRKKGDGARLKLMKDKENISEEKKIG